MERPYRRSTQQIGQSVTVKGWLQVLPIRRKCSFSCCATRRGCSNLVEKAASPDQAAMYLPVVEAALIITGKVIDIPLSSWRY